MYFVYVLLLSNKKLYKGSTRDVRARISDHKRGKVESTRNNRPLQLIHLECYLRKSDALRREKFLKITEGRRLLRQQIRDALKNK